MKGRGTGVTKVHTNFSHRVGDVARVRTSIDTIYELHHKGTAAPTTKEVMSSPRILRQSSKRETWFVGFYTVYVYIIYMIQLSTVMKVFIIGYWTCMVTVNKTFRIRTGWQQYPQYYSQMLSKSSSKVRVESNGNWNPLNFHIFLFAYDKLTRWV